MKNELYRQGDVLLMRVAKPKHKLTPKGEKRIVLALGETTGHAHVIDGHAESWIDDLGVTFIEAKEAVRLLHVTETRQKADHDPHELPAGWYQQIHQHEYTPSEIRRVVD